VGKLRNIIYLFFIVFMLSACSSSSVSNSLSTEVTTENPYGGFSIAPPASDEIVLTITGATTVELTLDNLRALPKVTITIDEPFAMREQTFEGVYLAELLKLAQIDAIQIIDTVASNEYRYQDLAGELIAAEAILAYQVDGSVIEMDKGGPIRLVFDSDSNYFTFLDAWNWSLREIVVVEE
jgi:hypothetical protein